MTRGDAVKAASALLAKANGHINLQIAKQAITTTGIEQAASWAREAADLLDRAAAPSRRG